MFLEFEALRFPGAEPTAKPRARPVPPTPAPGALVLPATPPGGQGPGRVSCTLPGVHSRTLTCSVVQAVHDTHTRLGSAVV